MKSGRDAVTLIVCLVTGTPVAFLFFPDKREFFQAMWVPAYTLFLIMICTLGVVYLVSTIIQRLRIKRGIRLYPYKRSTRNLGFMGYAGMTIACVLIAVGLHEGIVNHDWGGYVVSGVGLALMLVVRLNYTKKAKCFYNYEAFRLLLSEPEEEEGR